MAKKFDVNIWVDNKSEWIKPVLEKWLEINCSYIEYYEYEDCLYFYSERVAVSSFAGAIWKCDGYAVEELPSEKGSGKNKSKGRVDLYFDFNDEQLVSEAKLRWLNLGNSGDFQKIIGEAMEMASDALNHTIKQWRDFKGLSLVFVVPYHEKKEKKTSEDMFFSAIKKCPEISFYAWLRNCSNKDIGDNGRIYNSVVLLGRFHNG